MKGYIEKAVGRILGESREDLNDLRRMIEDEVPYVDDRPYSHNIISITLRQIADKYGKDEANKAIEDFNLEELGWVKKV